MESLSTHITEVLLPVARLVGFTVAGFLVFKVDVIRKVLLKPFIWATMNVMMPLYFIHFMPTRWSAGAEAGWGWAGLFFAAYLVFLALQWFAAKLLINRNRLMTTDYPQEFLVVFAMHNAGYIPLPFIAALAPEAVSLYATFFVMAFVILFFPITIWIIQGSAGKKTGFRLNAPTIGIALGLIVAVSGIYPRLPGWVQAPFRLTSRFALDAVMVGLGAILASLPKGSFRLRQEFKGYILFKMIIFPAAVLAACALIPMRGLQPDIAAGIKLALVLQAAVPPATNIVVVAKAYGNQEQVEYTGSAILTTYVAAIVLIPVFLVASRMIFS